MWDISELNLSLLFLSEIDKYVKSMFEFSDAENIIKSFFCFLPVFFSSSDNLRLFLVKTIKYPRKKLSNLTRAKFTTGSKSENSKNLAQNFHNASRLFYSFIYQHP